MIKLNGTICGVFIEQSANEELLEFQYFNGKNAVKDHGINLQHWFTKNVINRILEKLEIFA